jgi:hypothetical protein
MFHLVVHIFRTGIWKVNRLLFVLYMPCVFCKVGFDFIPLYVLLSTRVYVCHIVFLKSTAKYSVHNIIRYVFVMEMQSVFCEVDD